MTNEEITITTNGNIVNQENKIVLPKNCSMDLLRGLVLQLEEEEILFVETHNKYAKKMQEISNKYNIAIQINNFLNEISSIEDKKIIKERYDEFYEKSISDNLKIGDVFELNIEDSTQYKIFYKIKPNKILNTIIIPKIAHDKLFQVASSLYHLGGKVIINSIHLFEFYFSKILYILINKHPERYLCQKTIPYSEIIKCDLNKLKEDLIEEEVTSLMYDVTKTIQRINEKEKLNLEKHQDLWDDFTEVCKHRNILEHNDGVINDKYLAEVPKKYKNQEKGTILPTDYKNVKNKINIVIKFAFLLFYLIGDCDVDLSILDNTAFNFLKSKKWDLAEYSYDLLTKIKDSNYSFIINKINYLNAKKHINGLEKTKEEIEKLEVLGMSAEISIAKNLLLENNEQVTLELEKNYPDAFNSEQIQDWPIFIEYRKTEEYKKFKEKHKEDFEQYTFSQSDCFNLEEEVSE